MPEAHIGVIGGSGLYRMEGMTDVEEIAVQTPFGDPSDAITVGKVEGVSMAFLPRHGRGHIAPRDLIIPSQLFDRTKSRVNSFFEGGIVVHCTFAEPFCSTLSRLLLESARELGDVKVHEGGAYVCMEGPLFSTKAESLTYRSWGMDIIGMTALPEAKLAREAELCYATIACATDYDSWHESKEPVTVEMVISNLSANVANAQRILRSVASKIPAERGTNTGGCPSALANSILTDPARIPAAVKEKYSLLIGRYLP